MLTMKMVRMLSILFYFSSFVLGKSHDARSFYHKPNPFCVREPGNMGDVIQPTAMEHLLSSVAPGQCFWYAHPWVEDHDQGNHIGEFFSDNISGDTSRLIHMTPDHAKEVHSGAALYLTCSIRLQ